jgi:hypothetical protein
MSMRLIKIFKYINNYLMSYYKIKKNVEIFSLIFCKFKIIIDLLLRVLAIGGKKKWKKNGMLTKNRCFI